MDEEKKKKSEFVACELSALVKKINPDVIRLKYYYWKPLLTEFVQIDFSGNFRRKIDVNVTGDSLLAITKDILRHI